MLDFGSWLDISYWFDSNHFAYAPFEWGQIIKGKYGVTYLPIWESVHTGKYHNDEEALPIMENRYKLIILMAPHFMKPDNVVQANYDTRFSIVDYGTDLVSLVRDIELYTGKKY